MIPLPSCLVFSTLLFSISLLGFLINAKSVISTLMSIELLLLAVNTNFIIFAYYLHDIKGQLFVFFILATAAVEAAIGLAITVVLFRGKQTIAISELNQLKG